ncbi:B-4DMT family transporter [Nocardia sp. NPDC049149]|uniref:B-4DMT family transporter n=1 Tax=Nocardia sp. NPDC049149 TaxID=3364315 RepID=UPI003722E9A0
MNAWVLRAIVLGALVVFLRAVLGFTMVYWPTHGAWMRVLALLVLVAAILYWGFLDGRADRTAQPDPERGSDLTLLWLKAAAAAGVGSGLGAWLIDWLPRFDLGDNGLLFELTASAAFIVLLIFIPALIGVGIGRGLTDRQANKAAAAQTPAVQTPTGSPA